MHGRQENRLNAIQSFFCHAIKFVLVHVEVSALALLLNTSQSAKVAGVYRS